MRATNPVSTSPRTNASSSTIRRRNGNVVGIDYSLHLGDGRVVDASAPGEPLTYLHGEGQIVPGLESALEGLAVALDPATYGE